jgi:kinetochore protein Mis12/MTW1
LFEEQSRNEAILGQLRGIANDKLSFLSQTGATGQQSLTTNANFAMSQLPALRSLVAELRPKLMALKDARGDTHLATAKDEVREERRGYIEQRTKAHLERDGSVTADDAAMVLGKHVDAEEVQALEKVSTMFEPT